MSGSSDDIDLAAVAANISATVGQRLASMHYPQQLVDRLALPLELNAAEPSAEELADLERARPLTARSGPLGAGVIVAKRVIRRAIAWYVRPLTRDQTSYNYAVLRQLQRLESRIADLETRVAVDPHPPR